MWADVGFCVEPRIRVVVLSYGQKLEHELEEEILKLNLNCLWKLSEVINVSSLDRFIHPWLYVKLCEKDNLSMTIF